MKHRVAFSRWILNAAVCFLVLAAGNGCAPQVGRTIDVPEIPASEFAADSRARFDATVAIDGFADARSTQGASFDVDEEYTEPRGNLNDSLKKAFSEALAKKGFVVSPSAPARISGEIRRWRTQVTTGLSSSIRSEAAVFVEVSDKFGKKLYSGTFHGSRSSNFPVTNLKDMKESLGLAMAQAISQAVGDDEFLRALWTN